MLQSLFTAPPKPKPIRLDATPALHELEAIEVTAIERGEMSAAQWDDVFDKAKSFDPLTQAIVRVAIHHRCDHHAFLGRRLTRLTAEEAECLDALAPLFSLRHQIETMADDTIPSDKNLLDDLADALFVNVIGSVRSFAARRDIYRLLARTKHFVPKDSPRHRLAEWVQGSALGGYCVIEKPWWED